MSHSIPPPSDQDRAAMLDATMASLGLPPVTERRIEALRLMKVLGDAAQSLLEFPLDDDIEAAPVFIP